MDMEPKSKFGAVHFFLTLAAGAAGFLLVRFPHLLYRAAGAGGWVQYWPLMFVGLGVAAVLFLLVGGWAALAAGHFPRPRPGFSDDELVRMDAEMKAVRRRAGLPG